LVHLAALSGVNGLDEFGRSATPKFVGANLGAREHDGTCGNDSAFANLSVIHNDGAHADEGIVMNLCAVDSHVVADRDVVSDLNSRLLIEGVQYRSVLDVYTIANTDRVYIATDDGVEPYAALVTDDSVTDDCSVFGKEATFADLRSESAYGNY
jgi:hypothetical protein